MNITALVHFYVPYRNAGSETMLHKMLTSLVEAGHQVNVVATDIPDAPFMYELDGVRIVRANRVTGPEFLKASGADVVVTHHDNTVKASLVARGLGKPCVYLMHNDFPRTRELLAAYRPALTVFNTEWLREACKRIEVDRSVVVHPPVDAAKHRTVPGDRVTLVNLNDHKGGNIFYRLAEAMPDVRFLGVVGGHGAQIVRRDLPNVEIVEHTANMREDVWSRTRILLMPSVYESYGMAGVEAMASGIPVIANPTKGLKESLGWAGTFVARDDFDGWVGAIRTLSGSQAWDQASEVALLRSAELDPAVELGQWVEAVEGLVSWAPRGVKKSTGWRVGG